MEKELSLEFLRVVEQGAIAAAHTMGLGDRHKADEVAVEAMRKAMDAVHMDGTIVIGEGERDEAPMLFIGEKVGAAHRDKGSSYPGVDIAVDPLEGTNLCATGAPNAIAVLAASESGGLLHAPDLYMEKIVVGPDCRGCVDLDAPVADQEPGRRGLGKDHRAGLLGFARQRCDDVVGLLPFDFDDRNVMHREHVAHQRELAA